MDNYIITDGKRVVCRDKKGNIVFGDDRESAEVFLYHVADNILHNQIAKGMRNYFYIEKLEEIEVEPVEVVGVEVETVGIQAWFDRIEGLKEIEKDVLRRKDKLSVELCDIEKALTDIRHYIEFF